MAAPTAYRQITAVAASPGPDRRYAASAQVDLPGGPLHIEWREADNRIYMTGPAELAFSGSVHI